MKNMSKRTKWILLVVGIVVVIIIIAVAASSGKKNTTGNTATSSVPVQAAAKTEAGVGQLVKCGDLAITVASWAPSQGDDFSEPAAGNQFAVVDLEIVNNGTDTAHTSTMLEMAIQTPDGRKYDQATYFPEPKFPDGEIAAGEKARGNVAFEIPTTATGMSFVFSPITGDPVKVKLN
jgi:hypothetical protein